MVKKDTKVLITGSNGFVGKYLKSALIKSGFEVNPLKSFLDFNRYETYENYLDDSLIDSQSIIVLGWETRDRRLNAQLNTMLQTIELLKLCINKSIHIIFISTFNSSINSQSNYCRMKFEVESFLRNSGFTKYNILRPGLLYGDRFETSSKRTNFSFFNIQINFQKPKLFVYQQSLFTFTNNQIIPILNRSQPKLSQVIEELSELRIPLKEKKNYIKIYINSRSFLKILKFLSRINLNLYNLYDAFISVSETSNFEKYQ